MCLPFYLQHNDVVNFYLLEGFLLRVHHRLVQSGAFLGIRSSGSCLGWDLQEGTKRVQTHLLAIDLSLFIKTCLEHQINPEMPLADLTTISSTRHKRKVRKFNSGPQALQTQPERFNWSIRA